MTSHWLRDFVSLTKNTEIPDMFALWCGVAAISAALGRRIKLDMGIYTVYPNLYIVLVASSGRCRKSTAIGLAEKLIQEVKPGVNVISQKITTEALIDALRMKKDDPSHVMKESCEGFIVVDELGVFLNKRSYEAGLAELLIPLYDCRDKYEYRTKARGIEEIRFACLGLLGGSTIGWIKEAVPMRAVGEGLTSRIVFVYQKEPREPRAWTEETSEDKRLKKELAYGLQRIAKLKGEMRLSPEAREVYEKEYIRFRKESPFFDNRLLSGYASRRHVHVFKLGMIFSVGEGNSLVVERDHYEAGLELLRASEDHMGEVLSLIGATEVGGLVALVRSRIASRGSITRTKLMRSLSHQITANDLDNILRTLKEGGHISERTDGTRRVYRSLR